MSCTYLCVCVFPCVCVCVCVWVCGWTDVWVWVYTIGLKRKIRTSVFKQIVVIPEAHVSISHITFDTTTMLHFLKHLEAVRRHLRLRIPAMHGVGVVYSKFPKVRGVSTV